MIFRPEFVELVLAGRKTQTRRPVKVVPPASLGAASTCEPCLYLAGRDYAVQPGRGKKAVGRLRVLEVTRVPVVSIDGWDAAAEGFEHRVAFLAWWRGFYGGVGGECWRIRFELVEGP